MCQPTGELDVAKPGCLVRISQAVESRMERFFNNLGQRVGRRPLVTILVTLVVVIIGASGVSQLENESRPEKLWVPTGTRAQEDQVRYQTYFPREGRSERVIAVPSSSSALDKDALVQAMALWDEIDGISITYEGQSYTLGDLCVTSYEHSNTPCRVESVLGNWGYDAALLDADADVLATINAGNTVSEMENFLGGLTLSADGTEVVSAEALSFAFLLKNTDFLEGGGYVDPIPEAWEEVFISTVQGCVEGLECFVEAERSLPDEFGGAISGDVTLILGSYLIIVVYTIINLSGKPFLRSRILVSLGAVVVVGLSIVFSIGLASYLGIFYTPLHTVLPFILLGLGVDDSFVICNAFSTADPNLPLERRMGVALGSAGVSITVTSLTDFVAFMISATTTLPALSSFCLYAALGIFAVYVLQATMFSAFVVLDAKRQSAGRADCCPCFRASSGEKGSSQVEEGGFIPPENRGFLAKVVGEMYAPLLKVKVVKALVIVFFAALLGVCAYGSSKLDVADTQESFIPDGSYILDTNAAVDRYFSTKGVPVEVVTEGIDTFAEQAEIAATADRLSGREEISPYIQEPATSGTFFSWFDDLISYAQTEGTATLSTSADGYTIFADEAEFYTSLQAFLATDGARYNTSVIYSGSSTTDVVATAIQAEYSGSINGLALKQVDAMVDLQGVVDSWDINAFAWSFEYLTWETFKIIYQDLVQGLTLCLAAVFLLTLILLAHPMAAILVSFCVSLTIIDVLGVMYFWNLSVDTVAVINLVLAVGLSVDYAAHVGHSFLLKTGTKDERMVKSLADIGVAVIHGGVSTFLAVVLLSLSESYVFRVLFKQFFATVVLGMGHGLILLPVLLSLVGPATIASASHSSSNGTTAAVTGIETSSNSKKVHSVEVGGA